MFTHPGTKLLFQGGEFGQSEEWNFQQSLDWHLTQYKVHNGIQKTIAALNKLYKTEPALHEQQFSVDGFEWIEHNDAQNSTLVFIRKGLKEEDNLVIACNMTPVPREDYRIGLPKKGGLKEIYNSDLKKFGGTGNYKNTSVKAEKIDWNFRTYSAEITIPPLGWSY
jgi:1,4-alpha-glucan branching enzyme